MSQTHSAPIPVSEQAASVAFASWARGAGVIVHDDDCQLRIHALAQALVERGLQPDMEAVFALLAAADCVAAMACWLVGHMTYARHIHLDGRTLHENDFKLDPQGHTGGSLNMVPAYVGYLAANALTGRTRGWLMGQGHCVAAIDAVNVMVRNLSPEHEQRYTLNDEGLTRLTKDFYHYRVRADGRPESPLGSHVNAYTAGGILEGGYLGFADLQYVHMPLPGEQLVAFLSDGAFEEQRGADWAARWWRAEDCGLVVPIMIENGRRIDQRSTIAQMGGAHWFEGHLRVNGFAPLRIDGTDPAAFVWAILRAEWALEATGAAVAAGRRKYPAALPYVIAEAPKGFGFPNAGTNLAHGTPLTANPAYSAEARQQFNAAAHRLWVPSAELAAAIELLNNHNQQRPRERDNALATRHPPLPHLPEPIWTEPRANISPMHALDGWLVSLFKVNPGLRPRLGNPDELRSNHLEKTLEHLKHRAANPEAGNDEAIDGAVITALNEESVVCSALANKGGINLVVSYEAFAVKMLGALRQEIIFSRHQREAGRPAGWISVPIIATSHTWENGKNEQSHQDPTLCEVMLAEMSDVSRVMFPADANSALAAMQSVYSSRGQIATLVIPKQDMAAVFNATQARALTQRGAIVVKELELAELELVAIGAYQLQECLKAWTRLNERGARARVVYLQEPARFRQPRDHFEAELIAGRTERAALFSPRTQVRIVVTHTRPEAMLGVLRPLDLGPDRCVALGYGNHGGTLDTGGMLFANASTWAHIVAEAAQLSGYHPEAWLSDEEYAAVQGRGDPYSLIAEPHVPQFR